MGILATIAWTIFFAAFGIFIHLIIKMNQIENKRHTKTTLGWFITQRHWKFLAIIVVPVPLSVIAFFTIHPQSSDLNFVAYITAILLLNSGSTEAIDKFGGSHYSALVGSVENDGDQYDTQAPPAANTEQDKNV